MERREVSVTAAISLRDRGGYAPAVRPIRVLHVVPLLGNGGMEAGVMKLVTRCDPLRVVSDVCTLEPAQAFTELFGGDSLLYQMRRRNALDFGVVEELARTIRRREVDVVHTHSWGTVLEGWAAARIGGAAHVVHGEHGTLEMRATNIAVQRWLWRRAERLLAVSCELADRMATGIGVPRHLIDVIPNGVDVDRFGWLSRADARATLSLPADAFVVVAIGRLVPVKNHALLLDAAREMKRVGVRAQFLVAGDGPLRPELAARVAAENLQGMVHLLGHRRDTPTLLAAADVFALASRSEGMSNTILEAMAARRPVVATRVGGNPELVVDGLTGMLVSPDTGSALADALARLMNDRTLAGQMGRDGRVRVETHFSIGTMVARYTDMYESVTGRGASVQRASAQVLPR